MAESTLLSPRRGLDQKTTSVDTTDSPLLGPNPRRWALIFSAPLTNRYTLSFKRAAVLDEGITVYPTTLPLVLTHNEFG